MGIGVNFLDDVGRQKLDGIVKQMEANGEPEENIHMVVNDFKARYKPSAPDPVKKKETAQELVQAGLQRLGDFFGLLPSKSQSQEKPLTQVKNFKKTNPFDVKVDEHTDKAARNEISDIMYSDDNRWLDPLKHIDAKLKEAKTPEEFSVANHAINLTKQSLMPDGFEAKRNWELSDWSGITQKLLRSAAEKYDKAVEPLRGIKVEGDLSQANEEGLRYNYSPQVKNALIKKHAEENPQFKKELAAAKIDVNDPQLYMAIGSGKAGQIINNELQDHNVATFLEKENPALIPAVNQVSKDLLTENLDYGKSVVANKVSRAVQKSGYNNIDPIFNFHDKGHEEFNNQIAEAVLNPEEKKIWDQHIKDHQEDYMDEPSLVQGFAEAGEGFGKSILNTVKQPFTPISQTMKDKWQKESTNVSADPEGLSKVLRDVGHGTGLVASIAATGGESAILMGFFGDELEKGKQKYPDSPIKAWGSAALNTGLYKALGSDLFPVAKVKQAFQSASPEIDAVVNNLANGTITREAARQETNTIFKKAFDTVSEGVKTNTKLSAEMAGITAINKVMDKVMGADDSFHTDGEELDTFKSMFLSNSLVAGLGGYGAMKGKNKLAEESIYEAATNPKRYESVIDEAKVKDTMFDTEQAKDNLGYIKNLKENLDSRGVDQKNQKRYLYEALISKALKENSKTNPDSLLGEVDVPDRLKRSEDIRRKILGGEDVVANEERADMPKVDVGILERANMSASEGILRTLNAAESETDKISFLKDQALDVPNSLKEQLNWDENLVTDIIATTSKSEIEQRISKFEAELKDPEISIERAEEIDKHLTLLERGLEKAEQKPTVRITADRLEAAQPSKDISIENVMGKAKTGEPISFPAYRIEKSDEKNLSGGVHFSDKAITDEYKRRHESGFYGEEGKDLFAGDINRYNIRFENPLVIRSKEAFIKELAEKGDKEAQEVMPNYKESELHKLETTHKTHQEFDDFVAKKARELGHDGIIEPLEYVALTEKGYEKEGGSPKSNAPEESIAPESTPEGGQAPPEIPTEPKEAVVGGEDTTGITHAQMDAAARELGLEEYEGKPETFEQWDKEAVERLKKPNSIGKVLDKMEKGRRVDPVENQMLKRYVASLKARINASPTPELLKDFDRVKSLSNIAGRLAGKELVSRRGMMNVEDSLADYLLVRSKDKGRELTEPQIKEEQKKYEEKKKAEDDYEASLSIDEEKTANAEAEKRLQSEIKKKGKAVKKSSADYAKERSDILSSMKEKWKNAGKDTLSVSIPYAQQLMAIAPDVAKLTKSLIEQGYDNLIDIAKEVHTQIQQIIPEVTEKDVRDLLIGKYDEKKIKPILSPETIAKRDRVIKINKEIEEARQNDQYENKSSLQKGWDKIQNVLGIRRLVQTSMDASILFRQLGSLAFNPRKWPQFWEAVKATAKIVKSAKNYDRIMFELKKQPDFEQTVKDGVRYNEPEGLDSEKRNELYGVNRKSFIYKIPILKSIMGRSQKIADGTLNVARYELYQKYKAALEKGDKGITRESDPEAYKEMAKLVMNSTGSGNLLPMFENAAAQKTLGTIFYGARLMAANFNSLNPYYYAKITKKNKRLGTEAMIDLASYAGTMMATGAALWAAGGNISINPDEPDFLQIRFGDKVYDLTGGKAAYIRTFLRWVEAGHARAFKTKHEAAEAMDFAVGSTQRFFRNKLSPNTSYAWTWTAGQGKNSIGQDADPLEFVKVWPMYADDAWKAAKEDGMISFLTVVMPNLLGIGYNSYYSEPSQQPLEDLIDRNTRTDEQDKSLIKNYKEGGRSINDKEFENYIEKRDDEIERRLGILFNKGAYVDEDGKVVHKSFDKLSKEEIIKETTAIKSASTSKVKAELFGKERQTGKAQINKDKISKKRKNLYGD